MAGDLHAQALGLAHSVVLKQLIQHLKLTTAELQTVFDGADYLLEHGAGKNHPAATAAAQQVDILAKACGARL